MKSIGGTLTIVFVTVFCAAALADAGRPNAQPQTGRDLYRALGGDRLTQKTLDALVSIAGRDPRVAPYEGIVRVWLDGSLASSHFGDEMAAYYSKTFTEKELKELIAFLRTPTGQKVVAEMPDAIQHAANLSAVMMETNRKDLEDIIAKRKGGAGAATR